MEEKEQVSVIIFEVAWEQFAIELLDVKEIIQAGQIRRLPKSFDFVEGIYNYRGDIIHIINLKKKLNLSEYLLYGSKKALIEKSEEINEESVGTDNDEEDGAEKEVDAEKEVADGESRKFIIIANIQNYHVGFYVDRIINVSHVNINNIKRLSPIVQTSVKMEYIRGIIRFDDRPRILIDLSKILSEVEQQLIQKELSSLI